MNRQELSAKLDELIELGAGAMSTEAIENVFGKLGAKRNWSGAAGGLANISESATGKTASSGAADYLSRSTSPGGFNAYSSGPSQSGIKSYLGKYNAPAGAAASVPAGPGPMYTGGQTGPFSAMGGAPTSSANVAQKVAQQAGQKAGIPGASIAKKFVAGGLGTAAGIGIGGAVATPDWTLKQSNPTGLNALLDDLIEFADPRPRNPLGEFQPQGEGGPDPNAMATVYKMPPPQHQGPGIPKLAGAALVGGALGQIGGNLGKEGWTGMTKLVKHLSKKAKLK